jgi:hypothetical protein
MIFILLEGRLKPAPVTYFDFIFLYGDTAFCDRLTQLVTASSRREGDMYVAHAQYDHFYSPIMVPGVLVCATTTQLECNL